MNRKLQKTRGFSDKLYFKGKKKKRKRGSCEALQRIQQGAKKPFIAGGALVITGFPSHHTNLLAFVGVLVEQRVESPTIKGRWESILKLFGGLTRIKTMTS